VVAGDLNEGKLEWKAGTDGAVVALDDGVVLRLSPATRLRWWPSTRLPLGGPSATQTDVVGLLEGAAVVEDPLPTAKARQAVLVQVPGGLAGVTAGGRLAVVTDGRSSAVANLQGTAWASQSGPSHALDAGTGWSSSKIDVSPFPIAPAPVLTAAHHAFSGASGGAAIDGIRWSPVAGARAYVLRFGPEGGAATETLQTTEPTQPRAFARVAPGVYRATVAAIDEHGLEGRESAPLSLHVVGITLPAGASLDEAGAVTIVDRAPVRLTHAAGLLVAYGNAREWLAAPSAVRIFRGEATLVHVRDPRDATGFDLLLQPRQLELQVSAGPKRLVWPGDPVHITIRATDGHGGAPPPDTELYPIVTLGIQPLAVEFAHEGESLVADVPAPADAGPGPWVVRVRVNDQFGNLLGRDFVEIGMARGLRAAIPAGPGQPPGRRVLAETRRDPPARQP
jgi:hypothetical protein